MDAPAPAVSVERALLDAGVVTGDDVVTPHLVWGDVTVVDVRRPPPGPGRARFHGAAVLGDGGAREVLDLRRPADLARIVARLWPECGDATVAGLLARYARSGPFDTVVTEGGAGGAIDPAVAAELDLRPPRAEEGAHGRRELAFHTFRLSPAAGDGVIRAGVDEWTAVLCPLRGATWSVRALAEDVASPRYSPDGPRA